MAGFLTLHFIGLFFCRSVFGSLSVMLSLIGVFVTYIIWWIHKKRKRIVDYLKLTWAGLFIWTYFISWNHFHNYCSWCVGKYFVGIFPPFGPSYFDFLHLTHYVLLLLIAFLVRSENRNLKHTDTKTNIL